MEEKQVVVSTNPPTSSSTVETSLPSETMTQKVDDILSDIRAKPEETTPTKESTIADQEYVSPLPASIPSQPKNDKFVSGGVETDLEILEKRCKRFGIPFNPPKSVSGLSSSPVSTSSQPNKGTFVSGGVETDLEILEKRCKRFGIPFNPPKSVSGLSSSPVNASSQPNKGTFVSGGVETDLETLEKRCKRFGIPFDPSKYVQTNTPKQVKRTRNEVNAGVSIALTCLIL